MLLVCFWRVLTPKYLPCYDGTIRVDFETGRKYGYVATMSAHNK